MKGDIEMVTYKEARPGYKWALTLNGLEISRIRAKFEKASLNRVQYEKKVPTTWADNGYVREVRIDGNDVCELD